MCVISFCRFYLFSSVFFLFFFFFSSRRRHTRWNCDWSSDVCSSDLRLMPVTSDLRDKKFFVRINKVTHATPLFIALLFLEFTDVIFAVDSVPAIDRKSVV